MTDFFVIISLLPIVFMIHDFEEIIFFKKWFNKNKEVLKQRFPSFYPHIFKNFEKKSTAAFAFSVAEEFILLSLITYISIFLDFYYLWFAALLTFSFHLIVHIFQFLIFRKYTPAIVTSVLILPYCYFAVNQFYNKYNFDFFNLLICLFAGIVVLIINLLFAHKLGELLDKKSSHLK
jgi:hypothetical protein